MSRYDRPEALYFVGERLPNGEPVAHLAGYGINAADYEKGDPALARLTDDQVKLALDSGLYQKTNPTGAKAESLAAATGPAGQAKE
jgi:hypothetical protein